MKLQSGSGRRLSPGNGSRLYYNLQLPVPARGYRYRKQLLLFLVFKQC